VPDRSRIATPLQPDQAAQETAPAEGLVLLRAFLKIENPQVRRNILDYVEKIAAGEGSGG